MQSTKRPRIVIMGEEVEYDALPAAGPVELADHFKPVKLSQLAINEASKLVPADLYKPVGICTWLQKRAEHVFKQLTTSQTEGQLGLMRFVFEFDADGPVLKRLYLSAHPPKASARQ